MLRDANGAPVGLVVALDGSADVPFPEVIRRIDNTPVRFHVLPDGRLASSIPSPPNALRYESTDCSGPPLVDPALFKFKSFTAPDGEGIAYAGPISSRTVRSASWAPYTPSQCLNLNGAVSFTLPDRCCTAGGTGIGAFSPVLTLDIEALGLVPPFHLDVP